MKSIKEIKEAQANEIGLKFVCYSSVWDYYNSGSYEALVKNKNSNLCNCLQSLTKQKEQSFFVTCGKKGWSQHSETEILVFIGDSNIITHDFTRISE